MKKMILLAMTALAMLACSDSNTPSTPQEGALTGKFFINANQSVFFSQGNLQYQPSTQTWRFAESQYDIIGMDNTEISESYEGWLDLFGYGTGSNPTQSSLDAKNYASFTDWGANKISNGGNKAKMWRSLTMDEWKYILFKRPNAKALRGLATVNTVPGLIILPDQFVQPGELGWQGNALRYDMNMYALEEWEKMENAGAVFLPAGGMRYGKECDYVYEKCFYWSSTMDDEDASGALGSYVEEGEIDWYSYPRRFGQSVRLVQIN